MDRLSSPPCFQRVAFTVETHDEYWREMRQRVLDQITRTPGDPNEPATQKGSTTGIKLSPRTVARAWASLQVAGLMSFGAQQTDYY